jgi:SAM-dependent methyltransferase
MTVTAPTAVPTRRSCPVCGSHEAETLHEQNFCVPAQHPLANGYRVVSCRRCGLGFADSAATAADYEQFYAQFNKYAEFEFGDSPTASPQPPAVPPWDAARLERTARLLVDRFGSDISVLDVGCGSGHLLRSLAELGVPNLRGLDPSARSAQLVESIPGARGLVGPLSAPPADAAGADVITLCHVLEHVWDLDAAMRGLLTVVRPGAVVYAEVPDARRYAEHLLAPFHDFNTEHVTYFSAALLARLFERWGFELLDAGDLVIDCGPNLPFPATWGLFRRTRMAGIPADGRRDDLSRDRVLESALRDYVQLSKELLVRFAEQLDRSLAGQRQVAIWGVGELTMKLLRLPALTQPGRNLTLVDGSQGKQGLSLDGRQVLEPTVLRSTTGPVVVSSIHHAASITRAIAGLGLDPARVVLLPGAVS